MGAGFSSLGPLERSQGALSNLSDFHQSRLLRRSSKNNLANKSNLSDKLVERMDQTEELLNELRAWVAQQRGNQAIVGKAIGVSKQSVSGWVKGEARPNLETGLKLMAFLKAARRDKQPAK
jgi:DNA-binding XRE family transcriptional regulator